MFRIKYIIILLIILLLLGGLFLSINLISSSSVQNTKTYIWNFSEDDLQNIKITLPKSGQRQAFIKIPSGNKFPWFFDDSSKSAIDQARWGGGIPLILSGPAANRLILENATENELAIYDLNEPSMEIILALKDRSTFNIAVGECTPDSRNYYVRAPNTNNVATVDAIWYEVLKKLVIDPPYAISPDK